MPPAQSILFSRDQLFCLSQMFKHSLTHQQQQVTRAVDQASAALTEQIAQVRDLFLQFHMEKLFFLEIFDEFRQNVSRNLRKSKREQTNLRRRLRIMARVTADYTSYSALYTLSPSVHSS